MVSKAPLPEFSAVVFRYLLFASIRLKLNWHLFLLAIFAEALRLTGLPLSLVVGVLHDVSVVSAHQSLFLRGRVAQAESLGLTY